MTYKQALSKFKTDFRCYKSKEWNLRCVYELIISQACRYMLTGRLSECRGGISLIFKTWNRLIGRRMHNEINFSKGKISEGLVLRHPYSITVGDNVEIGKNVNLFKGCTIGGVRSGKRAGIPKIGDRVTICCHAMVCGGVQIGNDVLIAANAFVDFDVPDNSIVIGNPGIIHKKENASADFMW